VLKSMRSLTVLLGMGLVWGACSHPGESDGAGGSGSPGVAGSGQSGIAGSTGIAGQPVVSGSAGSSSPQGAAGSGSGDAGSGGPQGTAGSASGGSTGAAGSGGSGAVADMVDDFEDNDGRIIQAQGRQGPWHTFNNQNGGNQVPAFNGTFAPAAGGANNSAYAVHTTGSGYSFAGVGFDLSNSTTTPESPQSQAYNASAYSGISFWAKGNGNLRVELAQKSFVPTDRGGSCSSGSCWNVYGSREVQGKLTSSWQQFTIMFNSSMMQREDGSKSPAFDPSQLMSISFKHEGSTFDFWIDDVQFIGGSGNPTGAAGSSGAAGRGGSTGAAGSTGVAGSTGAAGSSTSGSAGSIGFNEPMPPAITSGGENGWASRYWDCCKPACGWTANAAGKTPIKSCNQQNQPLSGYNDNNICSGGSAFACWNDAPFQVGPNLSYGFAAVGTNSGKYSCGRCYQLQFTGSGHDGKSNSLNGKMMIVQVVNNGGVQNNQFDILIPGGGVGDFDGCSKQWGTTDLGARYGGFLAGCNGNVGCVQQKCQQIFGNKPDLLDGCNWFLGWFGAADNPNLISKEIACPELLKARGLR
jgi:hypothetical protein